MTKDEFCDKLGHEMWDLPYWGWPTESERNEAFNILSAMRTYTGKAFKEKAIELRKNLARNKSMAGDALCQWMTMKRIVEVSHETR